MAPDTRNTWIPWGQWIAVTAMTLEHIARFALPTAWGFAPWATLVGRIAFPLFAGMVAWHLIHNTRDPLGYALRMLVIALIAQLPYSLVTGNGQLNVIFTLAGGLLFATCLFHPQVRYTLAAGVLLGWGILFWDHFEYGYLGLLLVPALVLAFRPWPPLFQTVMAIPALVIGATLNHALVFNLVSLATVAALVALLTHTAGQVVATLRPMPRRLWLSWYPLHFVLIAMATALIAEPGFWGQG